MGHSVYLNVVYCVVRTTCFTARVTSAIWKQSNQTRHQKRKLIVMIVIAWSLWNKVFLQPLHSSFIPILVGISKPSNKVADDVKFGVSVVPFQVTVTV